MRLPLLFALPAAALAGLVVAGRRFSLKEDLDWATVEKPGKLITVDGYRVHLDELGSGPAFVMVHGFGGSTFQYRHLMTAFAATHRCIAVDLKGFGYSERRADIGMSHTDQAVMLGGLLDELGIERATFIGHSMGGGVVQRFAAANPERTEAIILAASVTGDERRGRRSMGGGARVMRPLLPILAGIAGDRLLQASYYDRTLITPELREEYLRPAHIKGSMDGLFQMMRDASTDPAIDYSRLTMPVMVLNGAHDRIVPLSVAQKLRERMPQARIVVIERAGHLLLEERPDDCVREIRSFMNEAVEATRPAGVPVA